MGIHLPTYQAGPEGFQKSFLLGSRTDLTKGVDFIGFWPTSLEKARKKGLEEWKIKRALNESKELARFELDRREGMEGLAGEAGLAWDDFMTGSLNTMDKMYGEYAKEINEHIIEPLAASTAWFEDTALGNMAESTYTSLVDMYGAFWRFMGGISESFLSPEGGNYFTEEMIRRGEHYAIVGPTNTTGLSGDTAEWFYEYPGCPPTNETLPTLQEFVHDWKDNSTLWLGWIKRACKLPTETLHNLAAKNSKEFGEIMKNARWRMRNRTYGATVTVNDTEQNKYVPTWIQIKGRVIRRTSPKKKGAG